MEDLLSKLTKQSRVEARETLREIVASLNGLAGLHSLKNEVGGVWPACHVTVV